MMLGSLDIYVQGESPGKDKEATRARTRHSSQPCGCTRRAPEVLDGTLAPPPLEKVK
jgi:hypothetical protein